LKNRSVSASALQDAIKGRLHRFVGTAPQYDDYTIVILKINN